MKLYVTRIPPCEEIAAEPSTLDVLTASLRSILAQRLNEHISTSEVGALHGFPLVADRSLRPGVVHLRPHSRPTEDQP